MKENQISFVFALFFVKQSIRLEDAKYGAHEKPEIIQTNSSENNNSLYED